MTTQSPTTHVHGANKTWATGLLWLGPVLLLYGLVRYRLWEQWPGGRMGELLVISAVAMLVAWPVSRATRGSMASALALLWCLALAVFAGPLPLLATLLFAMAATGLGGALCGRGLPLLLQCMAGMAVFAGVIGWLLPVPLHYQGSYLLLCLGIVIWRRRALLESLRLARSQWDAAVSAAPRTAAFAVLALGLAGVGCWLPTLQFDDLAYHLRLPWQLQLQGHYDLDPRFQVWALAPWASDVLHAVPQVMAKAESRGALNALWIIATAGGLWQLASALGGEAKARWWSIALFASLPMIAALAGSMQTELLAGAALAWLAALAAGPVRGDSRWWLAVALLVGSLAAMKLVAAAMAVVLLLWALARHPWPSAPRILAVVAVALFIGGSSYAYAAYLSGNPFLPVFNGWFKSAYFAPTNVIDLRWQSGFDAALLWDMTFDTDQYMETFDGGGGFLLVALAGAWLLALLDRRTRAAACFASALLLLPLVPMQYLRYAYPGLVLLSPVLVVAGFHRNARHAGMLVASLCVLNLGFQANSHWMLRTGAIKDSVRSLGRDAPLFEKYTPERLLAAAIREHAPDAGNVLVLDPAQPYFADLGSHGRTTAWYDPRLQAAAAQANTDASGRAWAGLLQREHIDHVIARPGHMTPLQARALQMLHATRRQQAGDAEWWSLSRRDEAAL